MKIKIIVPTFERLDMTKNFIKYFCQTGQSVRYDVEIIVVDDSLSKKTSKYFLGNDKVTILDGTGNLWWGGCINEGIKYLSTLSLNDDDIVIFANNDVVIDYPDFCLLVNTVYESEDRLILHPKTFNEEGDFVSSGAKVLTWFPYLTTHKINAEKDFTKIDLGTARFLVMKYKEVVINKGISINLPQYQGDNDFTLRAKKNGAAVFIDNRTSCHLDDSVTGLKNSKILSVNDLLDSFMNIKSANNIKYRYRLLRNHFNVLFSMVILASMTLNVFIKFFIRK